MVVKTRRFSFRSVHALNCGVFQEATHGHHYQVEVSFEPSQQTRVEEVLGELISTRLDCRSLDGLVQHSTGEILVDWIHGQLLEQNLPVLAVALQETKKNRFLSSQSDERYL